MWCQLFIATIIAAIKHKMRSILFITFLTFCAVLANTKKSTDDKVKIAVYYESLCPDSKKFIVSQLGPVWRDLRGIVKVKLVPYGKSTRDKIQNKWQFSCHHGPDECYGNKVQACILKHKQLSDTDKVNAIVCLMGQTNPDKSLETCLNQMKQSSYFDNLRQCADGDQGDTLLASYGEKTDAVQTPLSFVPTIVINESFNQENQDEAFTNLKTIVCRLALKKPAMCQ